MRVPQVSLLRPGISNAGRPILSAPYTERMGLQMQAPYFCVFALAFLSVIPLRGICFFFCPCFSKNLLLPLFLPLLLLLQWLFGVVIPEGNLLLLPSACREPQPKRSMAFPSKPVKPSIGPPPLTLVIASDTGSFNLQSIINKESIIFPAAFRPEAAVAIKQIQTRHHTTCIAWQKHVLPYRQSDNSSVNIRIQN